MITCLKTLFNIVEAQLKKNDTFEEFAFSGFILNLIKDTDSLQSHAAQIFFKVETLSNNAFK